MNGPHGEYLGTVAWIDLRDPIHVVRRDDRATDGAVVPARHLQVTYADSGIVPATGRGSWTVTLERAFVPYSDGSGRFVDVEADTVKVNAANVAAARFDLDK